MCSFRNKIVITIFTFYDPKTIFIVHKFFHANKQKTSKQASISNNPEVLALYERYKVDGAVMLDKYKHGKIIAKEFENWINKQKVKNKT